MVGETFTAIVAASDAQLAERLGRLFKRKGGEIDHESDVNRLSERFEKASYDILLVTSAALRAADIDGVELLQAVAAENPETQILLLAENDHATELASTLTPGTCQYARLPIEDEALQLLIKSALENKPAWVQADPNAAQVRQQAPPVLVGQSPAMREVYRQIRLAAATDIPVLLTGQTGTGKDVAAQLIHRQSARKNGPFVPIHIGALPAELVAGELLGYEKGAFTGAVEKRKGKFESAAQGSVFLDEISTIDKKVQVGLLRLIEQHKLTRLGGRRAKSIDVRIIAASNQDLWQAVQRGIFREDLYYRLNVFHITMPPLAQRQGDIPLLVEYFIRRYNEAFDKRISGVSPDAFCLLENYDWPGNVRELKNIVQRAVLVCDSEVIRPEHFPPRFQPGQLGKQQVTFDVGVTLEEVEREMISRTLAAAGNNRKKTAEMLGISRRALYNKLKRYGIF